MKKETKDNNRTADIAEMTTNQYAYQYPTKENDIIVIDEKGTSSATTRVGEKDVDIRPDTIPDSAKEVLYRTDVDEYNTKYKTSDLQNHNTASGLDITSYSVYSGFKEPGKELNKIFYFEKKLKKKCYN